MPSGVWGKPLDVAQEEQAVFPLVGAAEGYVQRLARSHNEWFCSSGPCLVGNSVADMPVCVLPRRAGMSTFRCGLESGSLF